MRTFHICNFEELNPPRGGAAYARQKIRHQKPMVSYNGKMHILTPLRFHFSVMSRSRTGLVQVSYIRDVRDLYEMYERTGLVHIKIKNVRTYRSRTNFSALKNKVNPGLTLDLEIQSALSSLIKTHDRCANHKHML